MLSLCWAIQTITSIGYGNIIPLTPVEWGVGSFLQLAAGVMWAYIIGGLVGIAKTIDPVGEEYRARNDQATELIQKFTFKHGNDPDRDQYSHRSSKIFHTAQSIRTYLSKQREMCRNAGFTSELAQRFPIIESLSPHLQRTSSLLVAGNHLENIPYFSSRFLSSLEQSYLAINCIFLEYPSGEKLEITNTGIENLGRGVLLITGGSVCYAKNNSRNNSETIILLRGGNVIGEETVLVENTNRLLTGTRDYVFFVAYTQLIFIPRDAIMTALFRNPKAWKDCARWKYLKTLILLKYT